MKTLLVIIQLCFIYVLSKDIPSYVHLCKRNDAQLNDCISRTASQILPKLRNGIPEMALLPLDPLYLSNVSISNKGHSMYLQNELTNLKLTGLGLFEVNSFTVDIEKGEFHTELHIPQISIVCSYELKGKMLMFNIEGKGPFELNATDLFFSLGWYGKFHLKDDEQYLRFEKLDIDYDIKIITLDFHNLFTGMDELTQAANKIFNENMDVLKEELKPVIKLIISGIALDYVNNLFTQFSINQLFPM